MNVKYLLIKLKKKHEGLIFKLLLLLKTDDSRWKIFSDFTERLDRRS